MITEGGEAVSEFTWSNPDEVSNPTAGDIASGLALAIAETEGTAFTVEDDAEATLTLSRIGPSFEAVVTTTLESGDEVVGSNMVHRRQIEITDADALNSISWIMTATGADGGVTTFGPWSDPEGSVNPTAADVAQGLAEAVDAAGTGYSVVYERQITIAAADTANSMGSIWTMSVTDENDNETTFTFDDSSGTANPTAADVAHGLAEAVDAATGTGYSVVDGDDGTLTLSRTGTSFVVSVSVERNSGPATVGSVADVDDGTLTLIRTGTSFDVVVSVTRNSDRDIVFGDGGYAELQTLELVNGVPVVEDVVIDSRIFGRELWVPYSLVWAPLGGRRQ